MATMNMSELALFEPSMERNFFGSSEPTIDDQDICSLLEDAHAGQDSKMDLLSTSLQDAGILKSQNEGWMMDEDTDALLNSILTGNGDETLLGFDGPDLAEGSEFDPQGGGDFDRQLLSPAGSSSSGNSSGGSTNASAVDALVDFFAASDPRDDDDDGPLQGVNPRTNSPDPEVPEKQLDDADTDEGNRIEPVAPPPPSVLKQPSVLARQKVTMLKAGRRAAETTLNRIASTKVYHHAGVVKAASPMVTKTFSLVRPSPIRAAGGSLLAQQIGGVVRPVTLASAHHHHHNNSVLDAATTTILLPVLGSKSGSRHPTIIRMSNGGPAKQAAAAMSKRRRMSASSSDSGTDDGGLVMRFPANGRMPKGQKYPRLELNEEERRLCEKEGVALPSHYPLTKEEERNLKRVRRKIRNKLSAQDSRKRKKEYVDSMEAKARKCAAENADLVKRLSTLETQNKTLVGQLRRLHQIIVNRGGIGSSNAVAQAAMGNSNNKGQAASTALMVLLLSAALFLLPGMKEQFESKPSLDIFQAVKHPPIPGQSRSLLQFVPQNIKEEYPPGQPAPGMNASGQPEDADATADGNKSFKLMSAFGDHDYVVTSGKESKAVVAAAAAAAAAKAGRKRAAAAAELPPSKRPTAKKSYIVADVPPLGYGDQEEMMTVDKNFGLVDYEVALAKQEVVVDEDEGDERRLNVNVTGGTAGGMRTVVLHVPKDIK